ncbi:aromatase/cyclase [Streptomyces thermodiastaticus]|jgi:ribosome-associated toxin RatA of RatAB toxin-antitoxin module|uniref:aromatase/cyclase n=1 Tax=Streptomyces thermodiastaticus TaxID=44061 RepID=UPI001675288F|nr:aromatase/cyclase [Streptomyces thermodiastaticus]MCE7549817.1 aromatase/cyclase [Streptomyces thermodiastaticus]GHF65901.1 actinorhodin polyketide synthase bifunctional cyclase/dehydratase [Streptomyces thermodiastaticus]
MEISQAATDPAQDAVRRTEHRVEVAASPGTVYGIVADVTRWPRVFGPTVHAERTWSEGNEERIALWATANGEAKTWTSRRTLDPVRRRVAFRQEKSQSPVAAMGGEWIVEPRPDGGSNVLLTHDWVPVDDVPDADAWIARAVDRNSRAELAALKAAAEGGAEARELELEFEDAVEIDGPLSAVYAFLYEGGKWAQRLPHVAKATCREDTPGLQYLEMETRAKDGSTHTTASVRVCFTDDRILYKQLVLPGLLSLHTGCWTLRRTGAGTVRASSRHTVRVKPEMVTAVLGEGSTVADAKEFVRGALGTNSLATLKHAKAYAEAGLDG